MFEGFHLPVVNLPESLNALRSEVRTFLEEEISKGTFQPKVDAWLSGMSKEFSRKLGEKGWIGVTFPKEYGGAGKTSLERYIITEELLAYGAPVAAHWIADRQSGPLILKYGTEAQKQRFIPEICKGTCNFSIGLSEPNAGSDLSNISSFAVQDGDEWVLNGQKIWTSGAHEHDYMIVLCRTEHKTERKHEGLSQLIIDLKAPGVTIRPIALLTGEHHFNEVFFEDVRVPNELVIGEVGMGWQQSMAELAYERSGPERILSTFPLLNELFHLVRQDSNQLAKVEIGKLVAKLIVYRRMSLGVAMQLQAGVTPNIAAALVKDLGTQFENEVIKVARTLVHSTPSLTSENRYEVLLAQAILHSPGFTLRGGTTEILRSIIARGIGL